MNIWKVTLYTALVIYTYVSVHLYVLMANFNVEREIIIGVIVSHFYKVQFAFSPNIRCVLCQ